MRDRGEVVLFDDGPFRERLANAHVPVEVIQAPSGLGEVARASRVGTAVKALPGFFSLAVRLARRARRADLLHATGQKAFAVSALASKLARRPLVWHLRDMLTAEHFSASNRRVAVSLANWAATSVIANSHATARAFVQSGGRSRLVSVIHNGISATPFEMSQLETPSKTRAALGIPQDVPLVGVFSRLAPWKGQHVLLEALESLPSVHSLFVGDAQFGEQVYARSLVNAAEAAGISARTHFLGFRADIPELMRACDVIVHTSTSAEPFGRVIVEGMLAGRPVIATRAGGAMEVVEDGVDGLLVTPGSVNELQTSVARLVSDSNLAERLSGAGRRKALDQFSVEAMLSEVERHLSAVAIRHGRERP